MVRDHGERRCSNPARAMAIERGRARPGARRRARAAHRHAAPLRSEPPEGIAPPQERLIGEGRNGRMLALGLEESWFRDFYHHTLTIPWIGFLALGSAIYGAANVVFAVLYLLQPGAIVNARPGSFADAFFFSVQTMATIGYGQMAPGTLYANLLMTLETAVGLMVVALTTGLVFARFSRPTARVLFSRVAVVGPHNGVPTLSFRLANQRRNQLLQMQVGVTLVRDEKTAEGAIMRRFYDLRLARARTPIFAMTFTVMHQIDEDSPLLEIDAAGLAAQNGELVVTASGLDETMSQTVHARASYLPHEILWDHRFVDVFGYTEDGRRAIDYRRFHDTMSL
jgi:inward rectifier potassium channel